jgi:hypothetical protein
MEQPWCAECDVRVHPDESLISRLGQLFHVACYEQRERRFQFMTRPGRLRLDAVGPSPAPHRLPLTA